MAQVRSPRHEASKGVAEQGTRLTEAGSDRGFWWRHLVAQTETAEGEGLVVFGRGCSGAPGAVPGQGEKATPPRVGGMSVLNKGEAQRNKTLQPPNNGETLRGCWRERN